MDPSKLASKVDPWLYFYEDFLAVYDPKMRNDAGVYYTPVEVVRMQVRLLDEILRTRFGRQRGLGADDVNVLDPAIGTGAYALAVAEHVLSNSASPQSDSRSLSNRLFPDFHKLTALRGVRGRLSQLTGLGPLALGH